MKSIYAINVLVAAGLAVQANAATFTVTTTNDNGVGSLRAAISNVNVTAGAPHLVDFDIPPLDGSVKTILLGSALPIITNAVTIDGYTQDTATPNTLTDADNATLLVKIMTGGTFTGLDVRGGNSTVRGLILDGFGTAINSQIKGHNLIEGNFLFNNGLGARLTTGSGTNTVGGITSAARNVIIGGSNNGIQVATDGNTIQGNFIGVDPTGTNAVANVQGILIFGNRNQIIGNVVSGNSGTGINMSSASENNIQENWVGTDATGTRPLRNSANGINCVGGFGSNNVFTANLISGNGGSGIDIGNAGNVIQGNWIGTDITGTIALSNETYGINLTVSSNGGTISNNLVSGNANFGINVGGAGTNSFITANRIGTDITGNNPLPNGRGGIRLFTTRFNRIENNSIAFNIGPGVSIEGGGDTNNVIRANSIFGNVDLGIDLFPFGARSNDVCDVDSGPNRFQNHPVLTNAFSDALSVTIQGFLPSTASTDFTLDFYANTVCDPSGFGEGEIYLGSTNVITGGDCTNSFVVTLPFPVPGGAFLTATATDPFGNTSEFSACVEVTGLVFPPGDVNGDRRVNGADSLLINQVLVGLRMSNDAIFTAATFANGDANRNGTVGGSDSLLINQVLVGLRAYVTTQIVPGSRTNTTPVLATVFGIGIPTNTLSGVSIGAPVNLNATQLIPVSPFQIITLVPAGGSIGTGTVNVVATPTNGVISFGRFINQ